MFQVSSPIFTTVRPRYRLSCTQCIRMLASASKNWCYAPIPSKRTGLTVRSITKTTQERGLRTHDGSAYSHWLENQPGHHPQLAGQAGIQLLLPVEGVPASLPGDRHGGRSAQHRRGRVSLRSAPCNRSSGGVHQCQSAATDAAGPALSDHSAVRLGVRQSARCSLGRRSPQRLALCLRARSGCHRDQSRGGRVGGRATPAPACAGRSCSDLGALRCGEDSVRSPGPGRAPHSILRRRHRQPVAGPVC